MWFPSLGRFLLPIRSSSLAFSTKGNHSMTLSQRQHCTMPWLNNCGGRVWPFTAPQGLPCGELHGHQKHGAACCMCCQIFSGLEVGETWRNPAAPSFQGIQATLGLSDTDPTMLARIELVDDVGSDSQLRDLRILRAENLYNIFRGTEPGVHLVHLMHTRNASALK